jgi:predicted metal-binding membrane protein
LRATLTETVLRRERRIVAAGLVAIVMLAWLYVITGAGTGMSVREMTRLAVAPGSFGDGMPVSMSMPMPTEWTPAYWALMLLMWWIMMIAMMVPSAAPTVLLFGRVTRHELGRGRLARDVIPTAAFAGGYLIAWIAFSATATVAQFGLERIGLVSSMRMWSLDPWLSAALLLAAGLYQLTPLKQACLRHCRTPARFLASHYRPGRRGALGMGIRHGVWCVGCCWALMALLFVGGIMNLLWIAGLTIFVLAEKVLPGGERLARVVGAACLAAAAWIALRAAGVI